MIFVYYNDGYCDEGDHGIESFNERDEAVSFIEDRIKKDPKRKISMYKIIEGKALKISTIKTVERIQLDE